LGTTAVVAALVVGIAVALLIIELLPARSANLYATLALILSMTVLTFLFRKLLNKRHINRLCDADWTPADESAEQNAKAMLSADPRMPLDIGLDIFAQTLLADGHHSEVVRYCSVASGTVGAPITTPFEPQLLDERDVTFRNVELIDVDHPEPVPKLNWRKLMDRRRWPPYAKLIWMLLIFEWVRRWMGASWEFAVYVFFVAGFSIVMRLRFLDRSHWLVVPGGLVIREAGVWGKGSELVLLTPKDTVLAVGESSPDRWQVCAARFGSSFKKEFTRREADLLIRVWCSPLSPPSIEQLSDLQ
jgi:hypothetical protein